MSKPILIGYTLEEVQQAFHALYDSYPITDGFENWGAEARENTLFNLWRSFDNETRIEVTRYLEEHEQG